MKNTKQKLGKSGGFTLVEMLIVVAIIAILIAVSIPLISSSLEKARHAVDDANERDAIALATVFYLTEYTTDATEYQKRVEAVGGTGAYADGSATFGYVLDSTNKTQGTLGAASSGVQGECRGLSSCDDGTGDNKKTGAHSAAHDAHLTVTVDKTGHVTTAWAS